MTGPKKTSKTRTVIANISLSLDGRVCGPGGEYDMSWIVPHAVTETARDNMIRVTSPATTVLLGRKNYDGFSQYWPTVADNESADPRDRDFSKWLNSVEKIVFSSTLKETTWNNSRVIFADPAAVVEDLRQEAGGDIIVLASSTIIKRLLQAGAIDQLSITLCPEVSGGGAGLFEDGLPPSSWRPQQSVLTETGAVCLLYDRIRDTK